MPIVLVKKKTKKYNVADNSVIAELLNFIVCGFVVASCSMIAAAVAAGSYE